MIIIVCGGLSVAIVLLVIIFMCIFMRRGKRKLPPADLIANHHQHKMEKGGNNNSNNGGGGCKDSDRSSNISDLKAEIRSNAYDHDYSEAGSDSIANRLAANMLGNSHHNINQGGVPLAGPVQIPSDYRYVKEMDGRGFLLLLLFECSSASLGINSTHPLVMPQTRTMRTTSSFTCPSSVVSL